MGKEQKQILGFTYQMNLSYDMPVRKEFFTIKGIPQSNARQQVLWMNQKLLPANASLNEGTDSFGNTFLYGTIDGAHDALYYEITGQVEIGQILYEEMADETDAMKYRHSYGLNRPGPALRAYFSSLCNQLEENTYVNAVYLMRRLHQDFSYQPGVTNVSTTAEDAWKQKAGVCQDYAHIFIALCHMAGIPARYVTGLITGEGASHAWVEILYRNKWIGMDPTNDILVARSHIKFGQGRDATDCLINRGILRGVASSQNQTVKVMVTEE